MDLLTLRQAPFDDTQFLRVAREVAADIVPLDKILNNNSLSAYDWDRMRVHPRFQSLLESEIAAWTSAKNTHERVKLKSSAIIEETLQEMYVRVHDPKETLNSKVEVLKWLRDLSGMGSRSGGIGEAGERFQVVINLGNDKQLKIEKDVTPSPDTMKVINGDVA